MTRPLWLCHGSPPRCPPLPLLLLLVPALCMASAQSHTGGLLRLKGTAQHGALQLQEEAGAEPGLVPSPNLQQPCWHRRCIEAPGTGTPPAPTPSPLGPGEERGGLLPTLVSRPRHPTATEPFSLPLLRQKTNTSCVRPLKNRQPPSPANSLARVPFWDKPRFPAARGASSCGKLEGGELAVKVGNVNLTEEA